MAQRVGRRAVEDRAARRHQQHLVEEREEVLGRLVDDGHEVDAVPRQQPQRRHHLQRRRRVEAGRRVVDKEHRRAAHQLDRDVDAPPLAEGDTALRLVADARVAHAQQPEQPHHALDLRRARRR